MKKRYFWLSAASLVIVVIAAGMLYAARSDQHHLYDRLRHPAA